MTDAELTILSLVAEGPRYGYEIQQVIDERGLREWLPIGFSSIYYILNKLEQEHLLSSELRTEGRGPARKVYQITEAGYGVLQTALADLLREPRSLGSGFELGLANLNALKPQQVYQALQQHYTDLRQRYDAIEKAWQRHEQAENAENVRPLYTHSLAVIRAEVEWLGGFIEEWRARYPAVEREERRKGRVPPEDNPGGHDTEVQSRTVQLPESPKVLQRLKRPPKEG